MAVKLYICKKKGSRSQMISILQDARVGKKSSETDSIKSQISSKTSNGKKDS